MRSGGSTRRKLWLAAVVGLTAGPMVLVVALAPDGAAPPGRALQWLVFVGSSMHVASSGWFVTSGEVRRFAAGHRLRFLLVPAALVMGSAVLAGVLTEAQSAWPLLAFFGWQLFHYAKQNLGMSALAARAQLARGLTSWDRAALLTAAWAGIAGVATRPELLRLPADLLGPWARAMFPVAAACFVAAVVTGLLLLASRTPQDRPAGFVVVQSLSLLFFAPAFCFASPFRAIAGMTVAHGLQYLLMMGLLAGGQDGGLERRIWSAGLLLNIALLGGLALNTASHLHGADSFVGRAFYGAALGVVMTHFVVDAALWRLRDDFPRRFLTAAMPYLLAERPGLQAAQSRASAR